MKFWTKVLHLFNLLSPSFLCTVKSQINDNVYLVNIFIPIRSPINDFLFLQVFFHINLVNDLNFMKESVRHTELIHHCSAVVVKQYLIFMFVPTINCWLWNHCVCFHKHI